MRLHQNRDEEDFYAPFYAGARAIEPLYLLWCAPVFLHSDWNHAFKMLR